MNKAKKGEGSILGVMLMLALVLTIGGATWSYANTSVGATLQTQGAKVASDVNTLQERYSIANLLLNRTVYASPNRDQLTLWIYNSGGVPSTIWDVWVSSSEAFGSAVPSTQYDPADSYRTVQIGVGELKAVVLKIDATGMTDIYVKVQGGNGAVFTYFQRAG